MQLSKPKDLEKLRRIALSSQGLIGSAPFGKGLRGAEAAIQHLTYIQLDSISVIERAHNHIWRSRVPNFKPEQSNQLLESATVFEYWAHAAAYLPMGEYRYYLADKAAVRAGTLRKGYPLVKDLGFTPKTDITKGLTRFVDWYLKYINAVAWRDAEKSNLTHLLTATSRIAPNADLLPR